MLANVSITFAIWEKRSRLSLPVFLGGVCTEVHPVSIRTEHKHACLWQRIVWATPVDYQIRSTLTFGTEIQNLEVICSRW